MNALARLWRHTRSCRWPWLTALAVLVAASAAGLLLPLAASDVLSALAADTPLGGPVWSLVALIAVAAVLQALGSFLVARSAEEVVCVMRRRSVRSLLGATVPAFREQSPGDLIARVTADAAYVRNVVMQAVVQLAVGVVNVVGAIVLMAYLDMPLLLITLGVVAVPCSALSLVMPRVREAAQRQRAAVGDLAGDLERVVGSFTAVKSAVAEVDEQCRLDQAIGDAGQAGVRLGFWNSAAAAISGLAVQAAFLVVIGVGAVRVQDGALSVAALVSFLLYAMQLSQPATQVTQSLTMLQSGRAALDRLEAIDQIEQEPERRSPRIAAVAAAPRQSASFAARLCRVSTSYGPHVALRDVSLHIPPTGVTALVGPSGAGKSTVLRVLIDFCELSAGYAEVADRAVRDWELDDLRRHVVLVEQDTPVLAGTLREALTYGLAGIDDRDLMTMIGCVGLDERFAGTGALEQRVGHRGASFSGGERQRVAVARALLAQPHLLALDEATSQLDVVNEARICGLIADFATKRPVVLVSHRTSTLAIADRIVLLDGGEVRSSGTHDELLTCNPLYRELISDGDDSADAEQFRRMVAAASPRS
jgi:ABC-type multidrug transport system fused ATPase/permease subunit